MHMKTEHVDSGQCFLLWCPATYILIPDSPICNLASALESSNLLKIEMAHHSNEHEPQFEDLLAPANFQVFEEIERAFRWPAGHTQPICPCHEFL